MRNLGFLALLLAIGGCRAAASSSPGPDTATDQWRQLVGCYRIDTSHFSLDSVPGTRGASAPEPGIRLARFPQDPATVPGYWFVTSRETVWVVSHQGWGISYEFVQRGDSLVGWAHLHSHVVGERFSPTRVSAVRATDCLVEPMPATRPQP
jgi:hypothetical protein